MKDSRRLIFIRKRWTDANGWSDAIQKFYEAAASRFSHAVLVEISIRGVSALRSANRELDLAAFSGGALRDLIVLVNHSICWWALWPTLRKLQRNGATIVLCMHEHEHILGMDYVWRHRRELGWKEVLRYSKLYHGIAARRASKVLVLAEAQSAVLGIHNAIRCSYLPVDSRLFPPDFTPRRSDSQKPVVLFAHDPKRFDKGHRFVASVQAALGNRVVWTYGREKNLPFDQVYLKYWDADILFLPSDWESYSLVFIEALACNKLIICSPQVGAARLLLAKYTVDELSDIGVHVSLHEASSYIHAIEAMLERVISGKPSSTRKLFEEFNFNKAQLPLPLL